MLKRKIYDSLIKWKNGRRNSSLNEVLSIKGARQVGKTFVVEQFGKTEYSSFIEINFLKNPELKLIFKEGKTFEDIYLKLSMFLPNKKIIPGKTLLFLDEIQVCGDARTSLKFLAASMDVDVITSGSLLGLEYGEDDDINVEIPESIPVGYEKNITMYSLDFEEYLWAKGYSNEQISYLKNYFEKKEKVPFEINTLFEGIFREYMIIGGMPEVVNTFITSNNFEKAFDVQKKILSNYQDDISKHAKGDEKIKVRACYDSVPKQLAKELKKFQYSFVEKKQSSRKYGSSVKWLKDSNLVFACTNVAEPYVPLLANEKEDQFKLYLNDTGLLTQLYGHSTKIAVLNDSIKGNARGAIYENIIAESLVKLGYTLHYYKPDDNHELEFLIEYNDEVLPIEVKSSNSQTVSLNNFIRDFKPSIAYKLISGNVGYSDSKFSIPHYMIMFL